MTVQPITPQKLPAVIPWCATFIGKMQVLPPPVTQEQRKAGANTWFFLTPTTGCCPKPWKLELFASVSIQNAPSFPDIAGLLLPMGRYSPSRSNPESYTTIIWNFFVAITFGP